MISDPSVDSTIKSNLKLFCLHSLSTAFSRRPLNSALLPSAPLRIVFVDDFGRGGRLGIGVELDGNCVCISRNRTLRFSPGKVARTSIFLYGRFKLEVAKPLPPGCPLHTCRLT